jgi:cell division cycle 20, cofactor of APC complex
LIEYFYWRK